MECIPDSSSPSRAWHCCEKASFSCSLALLMLSSLSFPLILLPLRALIYSRCGVRLHFLSFGHKPKWLTLSAPTAEVLSKPFGCHSLCLLNSFCARLFVHFFQVKLLALFVKDKNSPHSPHGSRQTTAERLFNHWRNKYTTHSSRRRTYQNGAISLLSNSKNLSVTRLPSFFVDESTNWEKETNQATAISAHTHTQDKAL